MAAATFSVEVMFAFLETSVVNQVEVYERMHFLVLHQSNLSTESGGIKTFLAVQGSFQSSTIMVDHSVVSKVLKMRGLYPAFKIGHGEQGRSLYTLQVIQQFYLRLCNYMKCFQKTESHKHEWLWHGYCSRGIYHVVHLHHYRPMVVEALISGGESTFFMQSCSSPLGYDTKHSQEVVDL